MNTRTNGPVTKGAHHIGLTISRLDEARHLALAVDGDASLDALYERLKGQPGVGVEFAPEPLLGGPTRHMMCNVPGGNIRVEFVAA